MTPLPPLLSTPFDENCELFFISFATSHVLRKEILVMQKPLEMHSHLTCSKALKTMVVVEREEAKGRRESTKTCFLMSF